MIHYKDLILEIKYALRIKYFYLHMKPKGNLNGPWKILGYSNAKYAGDKDASKNVTRYIVTRYIVLINVVVLL